MSRVDKYKRSRERSRRIATAAGGVGAAVLIALAAVVYAWGHSGGTDPEGAGSPAAGLAVGDTRAEDREASGANPDEPSRTKAPEASDQKGSGQSGSTVSLAFVGDVMFAGNVNALLQRKGYDYPYAAAADLLARADVTAANLETPVTTGGEAKEKEYVYQSPSEALPAFKKAGFDLVNLANNHVLDHSAEGLLDTLRVLDEQGIAHAGAGADDRAAYAPATITAKGKHIAFLGFSRVVPDAGWKAAPGHPGVASTYDYRRPVKAIEDAKNRNDLVVVIVHWGVERKDTPEPYQIELAHRYIDAGADLVIGSHPHVMQGFEQYKGKWIAYSLGNFIFTTNSNQATWESAVLQASCREDGAWGLTLVPVHNEWAQPKPMEGSERTAFFRRMEAISPGVAIDDAGALGWNGNEQDPVRGD